MRTLVIAISLAALGCGSQPAAPLPAAVAPSNPRPQPQPEQKPVASVSPDAFLVLVEAELGQKPQKWKSIETDEVSVRKNGRVALAIYYREQPSGYGEVEQDTKRLVKAMLAALMKRGVNPRELNLTVSGRGRQRITGEAGSAQVRVYGRSMWLAITDSTEFTKDK